jgi:hypothetical protein
MDSETRHPSPVNRLAATFHVCLLLLTLGLAMGWPRAGQAALLLPLSSSRSGAALAWLRANDAALVGSARFGGGVVLRLGHDETAFAALKQGWLLIAVPDAACTSNNANIRRIQNP